jgi:hypothetical protein
MTSTEIPEGFEPHYRQSPLTDPWEPLYSKRTVWFNAGHEIPVETR